MWWKLTIGTTWGGWEIPAQKGVQAGADLLSGDLGPVPPGHPHWDGYVYQLALHTLDGEDLPGQLSTRHATPRHMSSTNREHACTCLLLFRTTALPTTSFHSTCFIMFLALNPGVIEKNYFSHSFVGVSLLEQETRQSVRQYLGVLPNRSHYNYVATSTSVGDAGGIHRIR